MRSSIWAGVKHYAYACFAKGWNGAWAAVYGYLGLAAGSTIDPQKIQPPHIETLFYCFGVAWVVGMVGFLKDHPLPDKLPETTPPFATTTEIADGKITTTPAEPSKVTP